MLDDVTDWTTHDAERDERLEWLHERLPWLTGRELDVTMEQPGFPGLWASFTDLEAFAAREQRGAQRVLDCRVFVSGVSVPASLDLMGGSCCVTGANGSELIGMEGLAQFRFGDKGPILSGCLTDGMASLLSTRDIRDAVEQLERAKALPAMRPTFVDA